MDIDIKIDFCENLLKPNNVHNLKKDNLGNRTIKPTHFSEIMPCAGVSWYAEIWGHSFLRERCQDVVGKIFKMFYGKIINELPTYEIWRIFPNHNWEQDNRLFHYQVKKGFRRQDFDFIYNNQFIEQIDTRDSHVRYQLAIKIVAPLIDQLINHLIGQTHNPYLIVIPNQVLVKDIFQIEWRGGLDTGKNHELLNFLIKNDAILLKQQGQFDDIEYGLLAIGKKDLIKKFI